MTSNLLDELIERVSPYARALGVTKNEVKLYVTLLMEGPLTGKELAQRLGISQVKVYPMLGTLVERGWVRKTSERPAKYEAVPLLEVWRSLKDKVYDTVEEIERDVIIPFHSILSTSHPWRLWRRKREGRQGRAPERREEVHQELRRGLGSQGVDR
jgi:Predicted transcriptional regulators